MNKLGVSLILTFLFYIENVVAYPCVREEWMRSTKSAEIKVIGGCRLHGNLEIASKLQWYPLMSNNPYKVSYWQGSFVKPVEISEEYLHEIFNICTGESISSSAEIFSWQTERVFAVENLNLDSRIYKSYETAAMTESEAQAAFAKAKKNCEKF